jgi:tRNA-specific 2-thiouridylase
LGTVNTHAAATPLIAVAMSGGVDSSTAAALLVDQGHRVMGVMMQLWATHHNQDLAQNRCCSQDAMADARHVCALLGIPFQLVNLEDEFKAQVVDYFCDTYARGRTPNPCLVCNRQIKFGALWRAASDLGAERLATGHYARVHCQGDYCRLLRGVDRQKDQSYMLYMLSQEQLTRAVFPLGDHTKTQVRAMAARYGLPVADKLESQDACFISDGDYRAFVAEQRPETLRHGPILDLQGNVLGQHRGLAFYTVGQRQGLGIAAPHPLYVVEIDARRNALVVGPKQAVFRSELWAEQVNYIAGSPPPEPVCITAKIRYKAHEANARLVPLPDDTACVLFDQAQPAITPGQAVVFYQQEVVLGGGIITTAGSREE